MHIYSLFIQQRSQISLTAISVCQVIDFFITQSLRVVNESQIRFFLLLVGYRCLSVLLTDVFLGASREYWCSGFSKTVLRIILEIKWGGSKPCYGVILEVLSHLFAVVVNDKFNKNIYDYINMFCLCLLGFFQFSSVCFNI